MKLHYLSLFILVILGVVLGTAVGTFYTHQASARTALQPSFLYVGIGFTVYGSKGVVGT